MAQRTAGWGWLLVLFIGIGLATGLLLRFYGSRSADIARVGPIVRSLAAPSSHGVSAPARVNVKLPARAVVQLGLSMNDARAFAGYTVLASTTSTTTHLIDMQGRVVRTWRSNCWPALGADLVEGGHLLRPGALTGPPHPLNGPGAGGRIQEFSWDGRLVWDFTFANERQLPHHDVARLPNGNVLLIAWEEMTAREAIAAGRRPDSLGEGHLLPDCVLEVKPTGATAGAVVWEWHVKDHVIQDHDRSRANFGEVAAHPERIDINFGESPIPGMFSQRGGMDKLRSIGYVGSPPKKRAPRQDSDWTHVNAVAYSAELDQIILTAHSFSEVWVIDHGTTKAEAAAHAGGRAGKGGDLLYRWGNPRAHRARGAAAQQLYFPHSAHWIPGGSPGAGHVLVFNNGPQRPGGPYSSVDEIALPVDDQGRYRHTPGEPFGPAKPLWSYTAPTPTDFYVMLLSGAQRLPNGNTLICSGMSGTIFEVTPEKEVVWRYTCPVQSDPSLSGPGGSLGGLGPPGGSALFRASRYGPDDPRLVGKDLTPGKTVDKLQSGKAENERTYTTH